MSSAEPPELVKCRHWSRSAVEEGGVARLTCRARGAPTVTFRWSGKNGRPLDPAHDSLKYQLHYVQVRVVFINARN